MTTGLRAVLDRPHRRDDMRILTAVVALALIAQCLRDLARRINPRSR